MSTFAHNSEEKVLLKKFINGDKIAFEKLYFRYHKRLYFFTLKLTKEPFAAEEVLQEVFVKLWNIRNSVSPDLSLRPYLFKMAGNKALNYLRDNAPYFNATEGLQSAGNRHRSQADEDLMLAEYEYLVRQFVKRMPSQKQAVYFLARHEGKSTEEIALELNISRKTAQNHLSYVLTAIRTQLLPQLGMSLPILLTILASQPLPLGK